MIAILFLRALVRMFRADQSWLNPLQREVRTGSL